MSAEETEVQEQADDQRAEIEAKAKALGWKPREEYDGKEDLFVDAPQFLERGEQIMPILRANNRRLQDQVAAERRERAKMQEQLDELLAERETNRERDRKATQGALRRELAEARRTGDTEREIELEEALEETRTEPPPKPAARRPANGNGQQQQEVTPATKVFMEENPEFFADESIAAATVGMFRSLWNNHPGFQDLSEEERFKITSREMRKRFFSNETRSRGLSKVEGGRSTSGSSTGRNYENLGPSARAVCDRQAKLYVGPGKRYKDAKEWRQAYCNQLPQDYWSNRE